MFIINTPAPWSLLTYHSSTIHNVSRGVAVARDAAFGSSDKPVPPRSPQGGGYAEQRFDEDDEDRARRARGVQPGKAWNAG